MNRNGKALVIILIILGVVILLGAVTLFWGIGIYNGIIRSEQEVMNSWAEVENHLKRRADLIPNYVNTVKGFAAQERDVLIGVTEARSKVSGAGNMEERMDAENQLTGALSRLMVVVEKYPELKSNENFIRLQDELAGTENRIAVARMRYNERVKMFNQFIKIFPNNIIAGIFGVEDAKYFEIPEGDAELPSVEF